MIVDIASGEMFHIRIENGQTITMPATTTGQTVMGMVARPATVDTYAVDVDAGSLVFNQIAMVEGVQCWFDRDAYTYEGIPPALIPGTLLQGNHKAIPSGTTISITSDGQSQGLVVHVFYTMESERRGGWDSSLEPAGWISEGDGPNWMYQGNPQPMDMWKSLLLPGQTVSLPATTTGQTVMGLVVRPATTDEIVNGGGSGGNDSGSTAVDVVGGYAHMNFRGEDWYLVRRDHSVDGGWHPANDRLDGTWDAYGDLSTDPNSQTTFNVKFGSDHDQLLITSGDMTMWVTITKAELAAKCGEGCSNCVMELTGSSSLQNPRQYCRVGVGEDPWLSSAHHPDELVYGENAYTGHHLGQDGSVDALQAGGSNVWINALPLGGAIKAAARQFNGDGDFISTPSWGTELPVVTLDAWVKFDDTSGNHPIMNDDDWVRGDLHYQIFSSQYGFDVNGNSDRTFAWQPTAGEWNFLSVSYSVPDNVIKLSVNNQFKESIPNAAVPISFNKPRIGGWLAGSNQARSLKGSIASFRAWSIATDGMEPGSNRKGVQGAHLNPLGLFLNPLGLFLTPLGLFLRTSITLIWRILSAFLRA
jgi:hypothetical protein